MADPFEVTLPGIGQAPWNLNPAVEEVRDRIGSVEDITAGSPFETELGIKVASDAVDRTSPLGSAFESAYGVTARLFGVLGDGSDETAAMQSFINYIVVNGKTGFLPARDIRISSPLTIPVGRSWKILGQGPYRGTNIIQTTDNVPIVRAGVGSTGNPFREWRVEDVCLTYLNPQPATNTSANCWYFEAMGYEYSFRNVYFRNGYYGIAYLSGTGGAWGGDWDGIQFGSMSGGWVNMSGTINAVPNVRWGRVFGDANGCTDYLFKQWRGYNSTVDTIEVINYRGGGRGLIDFSAGASFHIGSFKLEGGEFLQASMEVVRIPASSYITFGDFRLQSSNGGLVVNPASGYCSLFRMGTGGSEPASLVIGYLLTDATTINGGYLFDGGLRNTQIKIHRLTKGPWRVSNNGAGSVVSESIQVEQWQNRRISVDKGDASVTVIPGETENTLMFQTPLTATRDVALPSDSFDLIGGLSYRVYVGANVVNGSNTLRVTIPGTRVVYTKTSAIAETITVEWRRNTSGSGGWFVTGVSPA